MSKKKMEEKERREGGQKGREEEERGGEGKRRRGEGKERGKEGEERGEGRNERKGKAPVAGDTASMLSVCINCSMLNGSFKNL
jgi:hypothetical protein